MKVYFGEEAAPVFLRHKPLWFSASSLQIATGHTLGIRFLDEIHASVGKILGISMSQKLENDQCGCRLLPLYFRGISIKDRFPEGNLHPLSP